MRILRITPSFPEKTFIGKYAGLEPNVYYLSREQAREGHEVVVATAGSPKIYEMDGIQVFRFKIPRARRWTFGLKALKTVKRAGFIPDIVHGLNPMAFGWLLPLGRKVVPSKFVFSMHGSYHHSSENFVRLVLGVSRIVDRVVAVSPFIAKDFVADGVDRSRITVIPSGVDTELFCPRVVKNHREILYVGSFRTVKRVDFLVRAFSDIQRDIPDCSLRLIGGTPDNDDYPKILRMIRALELNSVKISPPIRHFDMPDVYRSSTVVAMSSVIEGLGKILLEAGAVAKPTVAPNVGGIPDVVENGVNGLLFRPGNLNGLREHLKLIITKPNIAKKMGKRARKRVLNKFTWQKIARRFSILFENEL